MTNNSHLCGKFYKENALVRHERGVWQAFRTAQARFFSHDNTPKSTAGAKEKAKQASYGKMVIERMASKFV